LIWTRGHVDTILALQCGCNAVGSPGPLCSLASPSYHLAPQQAGLRSLLAFGLAAISSVRSGKKATPSAAGAPSVRRSCGDKQLASGAVFRVGAKKANATQKGPSHTRPLCAWKRTSHIVRGRVTETSAWVDQTLIDNDALSADKRWVGLAGELKASPMLMLMPRRELC